MSKPDKAWVGDVTYIKVDRKWLYLAVVVDLDSRKVIDRAMDKRMKSVLVCDVLKMALRSRGYPKDVMVYSDRGS